ncbi:MAG: hypothetical protein E7667_01980 [Ruminococcaceae bacterium]|nr:hypothetical protein [Oscillospiraceae bacterium]
MYIWTGIDVDSQLGNIKSAAKQIESDIGFANSNFTLPFHISLKMSFCVDNSIYADVINTILDYYKQIKPFDIEVAGIEKEETIVWIRMKESPTVNLIHDDLNRILLEKYNVPLHEYDMDYKFHTTLFMDSDTTKTDRAYNKIKSEKVPTSLRVEKILIGTSETGALGSYKVTHNITL